MKLLRIILVAALLTAGAIRSTGLAEHARTLRVFGSVHPQARAALERLAAASEGAIRLSASDDGEVIRLRAGTGAAAELVAWAQAHGLALPTVPDGNQAGIQSAEAVVADNDTHRGDGEDVVVWAGDTDQRPGLPPAARTHIFAAATWCDPASAYPCSPRAPPAG